MRVLCSLFPPKMDSGWEGEAERMGQGWRGVKRERRGEGEGERERLERLLCCLVRKGGAILRKLCQA